jgi:uncharacterized membrane protein YbhN (UPF0104 family)
VTRRVAWITGWLILTALIVLAARTVDWTVVKASALDARPLWLLLAVVANAAILPLATVQWMVFLPRHRPVSARTMFGVIAVTSSVSNGGPLLAGHAAGVHLLATRGGVGHAVGLSVTVLDQLSEGIAKVLIVVLAAAAAPLAFHYRATVITLAMGVPALWMGAALAAHKAHLLTDLAARPRGPSRHPIGFLGETARHLEAVREPGRLAGGVLLALAQKMTEALAVACVLVALGVAVPWWGVLAVVVAVNLSTLVSVTPANLGLYEASAVLVYLALGLSQEVAVTIAVVQHAAYLIPLAGIGWIWESRRILSGRRGSGERERSG